MTKQATPNCAFCGKPLEAKQTGKRNGGVVKMQFEQMTGTPIVGWHIKPCSHEDPVAVAYFDGDDRDERRLVLTILKRGEDRVSVGAV
jgi:hypothetical protein